MNVRSTKLLGWFIPALLVASYAGIFGVYMRHHWLSDPFGGAYSQAPLILLAFLWLVWRKRGLLRDPGGEHTRPTVLWAGLALAAVCLKVFGEMSGYNVLRGLTLIPLLLGIAGLLYPRSTVRALLFPVLFLLFAIPLPELLISQLTAPLQMLNAQAASAILLAVGTPVQLSGYTLLVTSPEGVHEILINEGCSGIRFLFAALATATLYLHLRGHRVATAAALAASLVPLCLLATGLRILTTVLVTLRLGAGPGGFFYHTVSGFLFFCLLIAGFLAIEHRLTRAPRRGGGHA